jgi:hypothetical protein
LIGGDIFGGWFGGGLGEKLVLVVVVVTRGCVLLSGWERDSCVRAAANAIRHCPLRGLGVGFKWLHVMCLRGRNTDRIY